MLQLSYGKTNLPVTPPPGADVTVLEPRSVPALPNPAGALRRTLQEPLGSPPLRELVSSSASVAITCPYAALSSAS